MKELIEWVKNHWAVASIIFVFLVVAGWIFAELMGWTDIINSRGATSKGDLLRNLILCIGAIGGVVGLHIAIERQDKFSKQVQVQIDQSFNDKLGRGVNLLAKEDASTRSAGIRVLVDLANNAADEQKTIIANIIYDFFHEKTRIRRGKNGKPLSSKLAKESRQDVQVALDYLTGLPLDERDKLLQNRLINYGRLGGRLDDDGQIVNGILDFRNLDFSHLEFKSKMIERISFVQSYFYNTRFGLRHTDASRRTIFSGSPPKGTIRSCNFNLAEMKAVFLYETVIELSLFHEVDIDFKYANFQRSVFLGNDFSLKDDSKIMPIPSEPSMPGFPSKLILPCFMFMNLGETNFNFDDDFEPRDFFQFCYYPKGQRPSSKMDASLEYEKGGRGHKVFVMPEEESKQRPWSGQPAEQWVAVEMARWRLERGEEIGEDTTELESELAKAEEELHDVQEYLKDKESERQKSQSKAKKPKPKPKP